jgi:hypothetical protein
LPTGAQCSARLTGLATEQNVTLAIPSRQLAIATNGSKGHGSVICEDLR